MLSEWGWLAAGLLAGLLIGLAIGALRAKAQIDTARQVAESQQRRVMDRLRQANQELQAQLDAVGQRQAKAVQAMKKEHATELRIAEEELRRVREQMLRLIEVSEGSQSFSGIAFSPTQIDEEPAA